MSENDLAEVFQRAARHAFHRHVLLRCGDIMEAAPISVEFATGLNEAWRLMNRHSLAMLPVVDRGQRVIGLLGLEDFLRHVEPDRDETGGQRIGVARTHAVDRGAVARGQRQRQGGSGAARVDDPVVPTATGRVLRPTPGTHSSKPEVVGQIMQTPAEGLKSVATEEGIAAAADLLGAGGQRGAPVVDAAGRLAGIITPATMTAVLFQHEALDYVRADEA